MDRCRKDALVDCDRDSNGALGAGALPRNAQGRSPVIEMRSRSIGAPAFPRSTIMKLTLVALAAVIVLGCSDAGAASFDCRKAQKPDEIAICDSRELSQLDVRTATLYETILKLVPMGTRGALQDQQQAWLRSRSDCGPDVDCIRNLYLARIRGL